MKSGSSTSSGGSKIDQFTMAGWALSASTGIAATTSVDRTVGVTVLNFAPTTYTGVRLYWLHSGTNTVEVTAWVGGVKVASGTASISADGLTVISFAAPYTVAAGVPITFGVRCTSAARYIQFLPGNTPSTLVAPLYAGRWLYTKLAGFAAGDAAPSTECYTISGIGFPIDPVPL